MSGEAFSKYARDLIRAAAGIDSMADLAAFRAAKGAAEMARSVAPVDAGELRREIRVVRQGNGRIAVESATVHSAFQEFGTTRMAPNPFMGPAVTKWAPELVKELERGRDSLLKGLG